MDIVSYRDNCTTYRDIRLEVPLDRSGKIPGTITLFAREMTRDGMEKAPRLVFFQGGPGSPAPRTAQPPAWVNAAAEHYRVVLFDQRGTGASTPLDSRLVLAQGDSQAQADYLACFRADSIVADAEDLRRNLGDEKWHVLGQSFGGFIITCYLSQAPEGLASAMVTAGIPSITRHADETYRLTWASTDFRNDEMFTQFPGLEERCWDVAEHLETHEELLPTGERLTPARLRMLGLILGYSYGPHHLLNLFEDPFTSVGGQKLLNSRFLRAVGSQVSFADNPIYGVLHEPIYAGTAGGPTAWSAHRVRDEFAHMALPGSDGSPYSSESEARQAGASFRFSGEHVFPWQMREDPALAPMAEAADILANRDLPCLYDTEVLAENTVPAAAWVYWDDMFVPASLSLETISQIGSMKPIITNDYHHDGLRQDGPKLLARLREETMKG